MTSKFKIIDSKIDADGFAAEAVVTGGLNMLFGSQPDRVYTVEDTSTGAEHKVTAANETALGRKIARGL